MIQNLRTYFVLYVIRIKLVTRAEENIKLSGISQRPKSSLTEFSGDLTLARKIMQL